MSVRARLKIAKSMMDEAHASKAREKVIQDEIDFLNARVESLRKELFLVKKRTEAFACRAFDEAVDCYLKSRPTRINTRHTQE